MNHAAPCTVLYADDEPELLFLGKMFLESTGDFVVDTCISGEQTLTTLLTHSYDAIISDYQMPGINGLVLLKTVREQYGSIPFILFTGKGREAVVIEAINLGVDFYLQKGGDPRAQFAELAHKIKMAVGRRRAETALRERDAQLMSLSDNLPSGVFFQLVMDPAGSRRFVYVSAGVETLHEIKAVDLMLDPTLLYNQILPEFRDVLIEAEMSARAAMIPFSAEVKIRTPSGKEQWLLLRSAPRPLADGYSVWDGIELDITATKRVEEELRTAYGQLAASQETLQAQVAVLNQSREQIAESEEKYRTLVEHTADLVFIAQDGNLVFVSPSLASLSGYTLDEVIGTPFSRLIVPEDRDMVLQRHLLRLAGKDLLESYEFSLLHKDNTTRILVKIRVGAGTYHGRPATIGTLHDVTKERQQETEFAKSGEIHRKMIATSPDIIVQADTEGKITFMNDKGVRLAGGTDPADVTGKSLLTFFAPESLPVVLENLKLMFERPLGPKEYTFIDCDKRRLLLEVNGDVLRTPEGIPYGMFFIGRDISDRKRAEETLKKSEDEFRNIIEDMQDVFYRINRDGIMTMISPYGARIMGYNSPGEICGKLAATGFYADPGERDRFLAHIMKEKKVTGYPLALKDRHGTIHYALANSHLIYDEAGNIDGVEGILHDITHLKKVEDALRQANRQIMLMTSITRHDIRNQLNALTGYLELSLQATGDPVRAAELIAKEQEIASIIGQQINFTTVFDDLGGKPPAWHDPVPLMERAKGALPFRHIGLEVSLPGLELFADPLLEKVFYNLFENALRYGGGQMTRIQAYSRKDDGMLTLVVEDNGAGIPDSDKSHIFERGFGKNTGLGLFLAREVLAITGMSIRETGTPGSGARFEITAPKGTFRTTPAVPE
ncbi:MAG: PAS domain S-box protein [Methanoregula sp.]|jgi:PAS domain S-box-containing protein